jgi:hypothetical protein
MNRAAFAAFAALSLALSESVAAAELSATALEADAAREGPALVVRQLTAGANPPWERVLAHIKSGQDEWLSVARALRPGVDADTGEDLIGAVAAALKNNPNSVLKLTGSGFPIKQVCDVPLIEPTNAQVKHWKAEVLAALARVQDASLSDKARACRAAISAVE